MTKLNTMLNGTLVLIAIGVISCTARTLPVKDDMTSTVERRDAPKAPLMGNEGPDTKDIFDQGANDGWHTDWVSSVGAALANSRPETLAKCWEGTYQEGDKLNTPLTSVDIFLIDQSGERQSYEVSWKEVRELKQASYKDREDESKWWFAAIQHAGMKMGGYPGLGPDKITEGNPVDAFKFITGHDAVEYDHKQNWDDLWTLFTLAKHTPIVFSTKRQDGTVRWYAALEAVEKDGNKRQLNCFDPYFGNERLEDWPELRDTIVKVVHWKFD